MKKRSIALLGILTIFVVMLAGCGGRAISFSWFAVGESHSSGVSSLAISAQSVNGHASRNVTFTPDNLAALHAKNTNSSGKVLLVLKQGDTEKVFDISKDFDGKIDTSAFKEGEINLRLNFENAENMNVYLSWE